MSFKDIPEVHIPAPRCLEDLKRPILMTKEYYDNLPEEEKIHYEKIRKEEK